MNAAVELVQENNRATIPPPPNGDEPASGVWLRRPRAAWMQKVFAYASAHCNGAAVEVSALVNVRKDHDGKTVDNVVCRIVGGPEVDIDSLDEGRAEVENRLIADAMERAA